MATGCIGQGQAASCTFDSRPGSSQAYAMVTAGAMPTAIGLIEPFRSMSQSPTAESWPMVTHCHHQIAPARLAIL